MMRWTPTENGDTREVKLATTDTGDETIVRYLIDAARAAMTGFGTRSAVVVLVMALIVATLFFGLSAGETEAAIRWCRAC